MLRQAGRDQESSDVMKLSEAITVGLLDGDLRTDVAGLPTQYQLGTVGYAVMDGVITDHAKILPLIAEVKRVAFSVLFNSFTRQKQMKIGKRISFGTITPWFTESRVTLKAWPGVFGCLLGPMCVYFGGMSHNEVG
ncbi:hypothetical protein Pelo_19943 [Pelomyxa schiedti]|nr:hypothetical protein Pelo_19943 [Pelomyxa schiedti]